MYIQCTFKDKVSVLNTGEEVVTDAALQAAWMKIQLEFIEISGQRIEDFEDRRELCTLQMRVQYMSRAIWLQEQAIAALGEPFVEALGDFERYNHRLSWNGDISLFRATLRKIKTKEKKFEGDYQDAVTLYENKQAQRKLAKGEKTSEIASEVDFHGVLMDISKYLGYALNPHEATMMQLAAIRKRMDKEAERVGKN